MQDLFFNPAFFLFKNFFIHGIKLLDEFTEKFSFKIQEKSGKIIVDFLSILMYNHRYAGVRPDFRKSAG